ncbi:hypothetical protein COCNU_11G004530 [Cocos nucifera]|uniref:PB1 domain-containing protein n=1 Tax=Cocos nucifera TaxID=13894 RepID=A0A8K0INK1_COCNU|nr:hypothetical protein COCNU_11G004530 [Cocos nucifera]
MVSADEDSLSLKNRLKLLCSYGGKILPRPSDSQLKYIGGQTRVLVVPRSISFSGECTRMRIREMFNNAEVVMKYQIMPEDLHALVSVTCDEDLRHMLDEYDRQQPRSPSNSPRFRLFLFSTAPPPLSSPSDLAATPPEQRYIEAINGGSPAGASPISTIVLRDAFHAARPNVLSAAGAGGEEVHRVHSTGGTLCRMANGVGPTHVGQQQHPHHHHRLNHGQQGPPAYVGGVLCGMGSGPVRYKGSVCGRGYRGMAPPRPPYVQGHHHPHAAGPAMERGGCVCFGHVGEQAAVLLPRGGPPHGLAFGVPAGKPTTPLRG